MMHLKINKNEKKCDMFHPWASSDNLCFDLELELSLILVFVKVKVEKNVMVITPNIDCHP